MPQLAHDLIKVGTQSARLVGHLLVAFGQGLHGLPLVVDAVVAIADSQPVVDGSLVDFVEPSWSTLDVQLLEGPIDLLAGFLFHRRAHSGQDSPLCFTLRWLQRSATAFAGFGEWGGTFFGLCGPPAQFWGFWRRFGHDLFGSLQDRLALGLRTS